MAGALFAAPPTVSVGNVLLVTSIGLMSSVVQLPTLLTCASHAALSAPVAGPVYLALSTSEPNWKAKPNALLVWPTAVTAVPLGGRFDCCVSSGPAAVDQPLVFEAARFILKP